MIANSHSAPFGSAHCGSSAMLCLRYCTYTLYFHTQHDSIHRFAESCHGSNLHSTPLYSTFKYIDVYYNLHTHQYHSHSHFHSESPTARFTTTSFHPTRHLLFILPLSQPHLLSFLILLLFWTNGKRSRFNLCGRHYSYPFLLSSFCSLLVQPYPSSSHTPLTRLKTNTPHPFQSLPNTLLRNNQGNSLRSLKFHSLPTC